MFQKYDFIFFYLVSRCLEQYGNKFQLQLFEYRLQNGFLLIVPDAPKANIRNNTDGLFMSEPQINRD